jgi:hypothetical protein
MSRDPRAAGCASEEEEEEPEVLVPALLKQALHIIDTTSDVDTDALNDILFRAMSTISNFKAAETKERARRMFYVYDASVDSIHALLAKDDLNLLGYATRYLGDLFYSTSACMAEFLHDGPETLKRLYDIMSAGARSLDASAPGDLSNDVWACTGALEALSVAMFCHDADGHCPHPPPLQRAHREMTQMFLTPETARAAVAVGTDLTFNMLDLARFFLGACLGEAPREIVRYFTADPRFFPYVAEVLRRGDLDHRVHYGTSMLCQLVVTDVDEVADNDEVIQALVDVFRDAEDTHYAPGIVVFMLAVYPEKVASRFARSEFLVRALFALDRLPKMTSAAIDIDPPDIRAARDNLVRHADDGGKVAIVSAPDVLASLVQLLSRGRCWSLMNGVARVPGARRAMCADAGLFFAMIAAIRSCEDAISVPATRLLFALFSDSEVRDIVAPATDVISAFLKIPVTRCKMVLTRYTMVISLAFRRADALCTAFIAGGAMARLTRLIAMKDMHGDVLNALAALVDTPYEQELLAPPLVKALRRDVYDPQHDAPLAKVLGAVAGYTLQGAPRRSRRRR